jgi:hypothetical protein
VDLVVTVYVAPLQLEQNTQFSARSTAHADGSAAVAQDPKDTPITVSFYRALSSETVDIFVTRQQQVDRIGVTVTSVPDGAPRAAIIRRLCRCFEASLKSQNEEENDDKEELLTFENGEEGTKPILDDESEMSSLQTGVMH